MKSDKQLSKILMDIYKEMYQKSTPKADIDKLIKDGTTKKENWFMKYYLPIEEIEKIEKKHCKKHKLNKREKGKIHFETMLGASPCSSYSRWLEETGKIKVKN